MSIRVLIVDDDPLLRAGLKLMLGGAQDIRVVGEAGDGSGVQGLIDRLAPDVILMDIRMPGTDGLTATETVRRRPGAPEVVILTTFDAGQPVLSPAVTKRLITRVADSGQDSRKAKAVARLAGLNDREREIAVAVGEGKSNAEISATLYLSVPTVKTRVSRILTKLDLNNRVQIALLVHDADLLH